MKITEVSLRRPVTTLMIFASLIVIGWISGTMLPLEFFPSIEYPFININIPYPDSYPEEIELRITRPVEEVLATISGLKRMTSTSGENNCSVFLEFDWGVDSNLKTIEAKEKIEGIRDQLPTDLERIYVSRRSMTDIPILTVRISSNRDLSGAYDLLNARLKRRIERIDGVSSVDLYGIEKKEIRIQLIADRITSHRVDLSRLSSVLTNSNFTMTAGRLTDGLRRFTVRPLGSLQTPEEIGELIVGDYNLRLKDIAEIKYEMPEMLSKRHLNRKFAVGVNVARESGANVVDVSRAIREEIDRISRDPKMEGINLFVMFDTGEAVMSSLGELLKAGLIGALLAVVILFIFLRQWRTTLIVAMAVPVSLLVTLAFMYFLHLSLNILSMVGLLLAVGMLVDNAVVVSENIYRHQSLSSPGRRTTLEAVKEVALAITAGTSTTAIVFLPNILNEQGEISIQIKHVAIPFCLALGVSLILAQTVVPLLSNRVKFSVVVKKMTVIDHLTGQYQRLLTWLIRHRKGSAAIVVLVLFSVAVPFLLVKKDMFPEQENLELNLQYNINGFFTLERVEEAVDQVEEFLYDNQERFRIETVYSFFDGRSASSRIILKRGSIRFKEEIKGEIRKGIPQILIGSPGFESRRFGGGDSLRIQLTGPSTEVLTRLSKDAAWSLGRIEGFKDVRSQAAAGSREVHVLVSRERARKFGFNPQNVARAITVAMRGMNLRRINDLEGEILVRVEYQRKDKRTLEQLKNLTLFGDGGVPVKLNTLADFRMEHSPRSIRRENRITSMGVVIDLENKTIGEAQRDIRRILEPFHFPAGYSWSFGRSFSFEDETIRTMLTNTLMALLLIYFVMASLFESLLFPAAIWTSILFAIVGVWWFFLITGTTFDLMAWFGVLILIGVVVNNGIVLIDYINQLRARDIPRSKAIIQAGGDRLRPILMTAGTTVLSLLPLCITRTQIGGDGPPYFPMARAIVGGLIFSTLVTLVILPTIYIFLDELRAWSRRVFRQVRA